MGEHTRFAQYQYSVWIFLAFLLINSGFCQQPVRVTRNVEVTAVEEKVRDKLGYQAIIEIHRDMDDDHSGSIDRNESTGFMKEDMQMRGTDQTRRENKFHGDDDAITVDDLWEAWFESEERSWTTDRLVEWLINDVNLPSIVDVIKRRKFDGKVLPRFASPNADFLSKELGVKSTVYRQKLRLNSLDVVLFGYRDTSNRTKDIILALLALLLTSLAFLYVRQKQRAQQKVHELHTRLKELKSMETEFDDVQKMLNDERSKRSTADGGVSQKEMEILRDQLEEAERRLEANSNGSETPLALQPLLRRTCENEMAFLEKQRQECFKEMKDAIEMVDRLQKKQGSVLSSLKLATGASSTSDQVDSKIFALKSRMEKIHALTRETQERWMQIESLCGFPVLYVNETDHINKVSNHFYNPNSATSEARQRRYRSFASADFENGGALSNGSSSTVSGSVSNGQLQQQQQRRKISTASKANSVPATTNIRFTAKLKEPARNESLPEMETDFEKENGVAQSSNSFDEIRPEDRASINFKHNGNGGKLIQEDDAQSVQTTTSSSTIETKKKRSILPKFFRKSVSKGSLNNNSTGS